LQSFVTRVLGPGGEPMAGAMHMALEFLDGHSTGELLERVGTRIEAVPRIQPIDKKALQDSYGGKQTEACDDLLAGRGMFYITEQGRLFLDCTSGHYQMLWGYNDPALSEALAEGVRAGIVWDNHANVPQWPVKQLGHRLVEAANPPGETDPLDTVLVGCCTGSVACEAALKIVLVCAERRGKGGGPPVMVVLDGNYHGTTVFGQYLRGMWTQHVKDLDVVAVQPNDAEELRGVFERYGRRIAGFWAEPIMMNREVIVVETPYLQLARKLCTESGALMVMDEIQTCFWQSEIFAYRALGFVPDLVVAGKGMTAGFHPLAAVVYKSRLDVLAQYDAINTNGSAPLPSYMALCNMDTIQAQGARIVSAGTRYMDGMGTLAGEFPDVLQDTRGRQHMMGVKFKQVDAAIAFHRRLLEAGLWTRVHAYHAGHSTVLTKLGLAADEQIVDFVVEKFRSLLKEE